jgi:hypothetical protein
MMYSEILDFHNVDGAANGLIEEQVPMMPADIATTQQVN